mmetsp:Transcript_1350/g.2386  ORF Transcript_1350/g.2386 Transcript_1350/m.2386 type:complete len:135 (+) Transcript_1350:71-475(+)
MSRLLRKTWNRLTRRVKEETDTNAVTMVGWLHKRGDINPGWKKRYCTLTDTDLKYYKKPSDVFPQGHVNLSDCIVIKSGQAAGLTEMGGKKNDNGFVLIARDRTYAFMAETTQEKYEWIQNVGEIMIRLKVGHS